MEIPQIVKIKRVNTLSVHKRDWHMHGTFEVFPIVVTALLLPIQNA